MTSDKIDDEKRRIGPEGIIPHSRAMGLTEDEIQEKIARLPDDNSDKDHIITLYLDSVKKERREEVAKKLRGDSPK